MSRKYVYPSIEELKYLYIECDQTSKEVAKKFGIPEYTIRYILRRNNIVKPIDAWKNYRGKKALEELKKKGFTNEKLKIMYENKKMSISNIADLYEVSDSYMSRLVDLAGIKKRSHSETMILAGKQTIARRKEASKTKFNKRIEAIKNKVKGEHLSHIEACKLVSCDLGIERLKKLCNIYGYDLEILSNTYRKLERVWFNLNQYPKIMIKIAIVLFLRYEIPLGVVTHICKITPSGFRNNYKALSKNIKLTKIRRVDPLPLINIANLFRTNEELIVGLESPIPPLMKIITVRQMELEQYKTLREYFKIKKESLN